MRTEHTHVEHYGRAFRVLASFPEVEVTAAIAFMRESQGADLLRIRDGVAYLANEDDQGPPRNHAAPR